MWADRGDATVIINENGAVLNGRRRDGVHELRSNTQHYGDTPEPNTECDGQYCVGSVPG